MTRILFFLLLFTTGYHGLSAEITILATSHSDAANGCNGTITVRATGTAGPFTIYVYDHVNEVGIYFVRVIRGDGVEGTAKVLLQ